MAAVTIRNLSDEAHRALKVRAAQHNRSTEAEMRASDTAGSAAHSHSIVPGGLLVTS